VTSKPSSPGRRSAPTRASTPAFPPGQADAPLHLNWWLASAWACRSRIPAFVTLSKTVRDNREWILAAVDLELSYGATGAAGPASRNGARSPVSNASPEGGEHLRHRVSGLHEQPKPFVWTATTEPILIGSDGYVWSGPALDLTLLIHAQHHRLGS